MDTNHSTSHTPNPHKRTRKCSESEHDPTDWESENDSIDWESENIPIAWNFNNENFPPNIVVAPRPSSSPCLSNLSPIAIGRQLKEQKINPLKVTKNSNRLNIRVSNAKDCNNLLKLKTFCGIEVKIEPHATLNNSKGVIKNNELKYCTIEEMESMKGITDAHQIIRTENGKEIKTGTWFLTFDRPICPKFIDIEYLKNIPVLPYIPKPMKCHNCQRFGHTKKRCKGKARCSQCGEAPHKEKCNKEAYCPNCKKDGHTALSTECPIHGELKKILKFQAENGGSFKEAKETIRQRDTRYRDILLQPNQLNNQDAKNNQKPNPNNPKYPQTKPEHQIKTQETNSSKPDTNLTQHRKPLKSNLEYTSHKTPQTTQVNKVVEDDLKITTNNRFDLLATNNSQDLFSPEAPSQISVITRGRPHPPQVAPPPPPPSTP